MNSFWKEVEENFHQAITRFPTADEQRDWILHQGLPDQLQQEILELLAHHQECSKDSGGLLENPFTLNLGKFLVSPLSFQVGDELGRYHIERILSSQEGREVYLVKEQQGRALVLKRFLVGEKEGEYLARLRHPHILKVEEVLEFEHHQFLVLPFIEGPTLQEMVKEANQDRLNLEKWAKVRSSKQDQEDSVLDLFEREKIHGLDPFQEVLMMTLHVLLALEYLHQQGLLHLDLKPANIIFDSSRGKFLLMDLGISQSLGTMGGKGTVVSKRVLGGTPGFMAPEQEEGLMSGELIAGGEKAPSLSVKTDIYALGKILELVLSSVNEKASPKIVAVFRQINQRMLDPDPRQRPTSKELFSWPQALNYAHTLSKLAGTEIWFEYCKSKYLPRVNLRPVYRWGLLVGIFWGGLFGKVGGMWAQLIFLAMGIHFMKKIVLFLFYLHEMKSRRWTALAMMMFSVACFGLVGPGNILYAYAYSYASFEPFPERVEASTLAFTPHWIIVEKVATEDGLHLGELEEKIKGKRALLLGETHWHSQVEDLAAQIVWAANRIQHFPTLFLEHQYSSATFFNHYLQLKDDSEAERFLDEVLSDLVPTENLWQLLQELRTWNKAHPERPIRLAMNDVENNWKGTLKFIVYPYFRHQGPSGSELPDVETLHPDQAYFLLRELQAALDKLSRPREFPGRPFLTKAYMKNVLGNLIATYEVFAATRSEGEEAGALARQKTILHNMTDPLINGAALQAPFILHGGRLHIEKGNCSHERPDAPQELSFWSEGAFLHCRFPGTRKRTYHLALQGMDMRLGKMRKRSRQVSHFNGDLYWRIVEAFQIRLNRGLIDPGQYYFIWPRHFERPLHELFYYWSHQHGHAPLLIKDVKWDLLLRKAARMGAGYAAKMEQIKREAKAVDGTIVVTRSELSPTRALGGE